jgi:hypothetical protein
MRSFKRKVGRDTRTAAVRIRQRRTSVHVRALGNDHAKVAPPGRGDLEQAFMR